MTLLDSIGMTAALLTGVPTAAILTWVGVLSLQRHAASIGLIDVPNERSSHVTPTPRGGGLAFVVITTFLTGLAGFQHEGFLPTGSGTLLMCSLSVALVGLIDDRWRLSARLRLIVQSGSAIYFVIYGMPPGTYYLTAGFPVAFGWVSGSLSVIWMVAVTNAFNFMDGIDGLVASQFVIFALVLSLLCHTAGEPGIAVAMALLSGAVSGFLLHNWPPARVFMGDVGSGYLGFVFAGWAIISAGQYSSSVSISVWLILGAPLLTDATFTLLSRALRGEPIFRPHRKHLYQRLVRFGWTHLQVTVLYSSVTVVISTATLAYYVVGIIPWQSYAFFSAVSLSVVPITVWRTELRQT